MNHPFEPAAPPIAGVPIRYIRPEFPSFELPAYRGRRYTRLVPDTLDLQERAALAVNGLTAPTDPAADYEIYWVIFPRAHPPMMQHDWNDHCQGKYMETLPLMRLASGSDLNLHVERRWMETILQMRGPDGLLYYPKQGRPWHNVSCFGPEAPGEHYFSMGISGRLLNAITIQHQLTDNPLWAETGRRFVDGVANLTMDEGAYASFAWIQYGLGGAIPAGVDARYTPGYSMANWTASLIGGFSHFYHSVGYEPALTLARKLSRWIMDRGNPFAPNGRYLHEPIKGQTHDDAGAAETLGTASYAHFHGHTIILLALLEYALQVGDRDILDFVVRGYLYGRANGNSLTGYFPEVLGRPDFEDCETCCTADMVSLALKLTAAGLGDFWDDADRWIRNQLAENQMTRADWAESLWEMGPAHLRDWDIKPSVLDPSHQTTERVLARNIGGFAAHATANDFSTGKTAITACCTGNGARALYQAWERILDCAGGKLCVNLLLNRASPWADVDSYIPYEGRVDIRMKDDCDLAVRIPEWVRPEQTTCQVDDVERALDWEGRYALAGGVRAGQVVTLTFPMVERSERVYIQHHRYTLDRKGNDVIAVRPGGLYLPLYQREHYRRGEARWRMIERFVPETTLGW